MNTSINTASDRLPITVFMECFPAVTRWSGVQWRLAAVHPAADVAAPGHVAEAGGDNGDGQRMLRWDGLSITLNKSSCPAYYENLRSETAKVFAVGSHSSGGDFEPRLVTLDFTEAEAYMEAGEPVYSCAIAPAIYLWLEHFVLTHYQPQPFIKRQRKAWHS